MIRIYKNDCEDFDNNGLGILSDFKTSPKIKEALNGKFELNFDYIRYGKNSEYIVVDNIIKAPYDGTYQLFRIKAVKPNLKTISVYAVHIFYDLEANFLLDVAPTKKSGVNAIIWLLDNAMFPTKFKVTGDLIPDNSARYVKKNIVEAILGTDNAIVKRWGGEIERDNFNIIYHKQRGHDKGVYLKEGKNIKEIVISIDFTSVTTRVVPQGSNGLSLPETYVDSPLIKTYRNPFVKKYEFSNITVNEETNEEQAYEQLRQAAQQLFDKDGIDKPKISVKVDWLDLSKTEEYRIKYANFESVRLGDIVTVQALGYEYKIRVITVEYDCILKRFTSFEIGDEKADYVSKQSESIVHEIQNQSSSILEQAKKAASTLINNGFGGHVRVYPDRILIMDTEDEATAKNVWQWNLNGFGYSSSGVNGEYETAITIDGQIIADRITAGTMSVQRINGLADTLGEINTSIELNENNITSCVTSINNNYQDLNNKLGNFATSDDIATVTNKVEELTTSTEKTIKIVNDIQINGATHVMTEEGYTFNDKGLEIDNSSSPVKGLFNEKGMDITNKQNNTTILFAGYVDENNQKYSKYKGQTLLGADLVVARTLVLGSHSQFDDYIDEDGNEGTGPFET